MMLGDILRRVEPFTPNPDAGSRLVARQTATFMSLFGLSMVALRHVPDAHPLAVPVLLVTVWTLVATALWLPLAGKRLSMWWHTRQYSNDGRWSL
mgnify:CR=1 FL=1